MVMKETDELGLNVTQESQRRSLFTWIPSSCCGEGP
jgi:hypothetical protein